MFTLTRLSFLGMVAEQTTLGSNLSSMLALTEFGTSQSQLVSLLNRKPQNLQICQNWTNEVIYPTIC